MVESTSSMGDLFPDLGVEAPVISGIAHDRSELMVTVRGVKDEPGRAAQIFRSLAQAGVNIDMIAQASASSKTADISLTAPNGCLADVKRILHQMRDDLSYSSVEIDPHVGKVAVVGIGMKAHAGLAATFFNALSDHNINILMISTSEIRIAALVPAEQLDDAVRALHTAYHLDASKIEAVVYGGSGR